MTTVQAFDLFFFLNKETKVWGGEKQKPEEFSLTALKWLSVLNVDEQNEHTLYISRCNLRYHMSDQNGEQTTFKKVFWVMGNHVFK